MASILVSSLSFWASVRSSPTCITWRQHVALGTRLTPSHHLALRGISQGVNGRSTSSAAVCVCARAQQPGVYRQASAPTSCLSTHPRVFIVPFTNFPRRSSVIFDLGLNPSHLASSSSLIAAVDFVQPHTCINLHINGKDQKRTRLRTNPPPKTPACRPTSAESTCSSSWLLS